MLACQKNRRYENLLARFENRVRAYTVQPARRGRYKEKHCVHQQVEMVRVSARC